MKIGAKFTIMQLTIVFGFFISASIVMFLLIESDELKELEVHVSSSLNSLENLIEKTRLFPRRGTTISILWDDWEISYKRLNYLYNEIETKASLILFLPQSLRNIIDSTTSSWDLMTRSYFPSISSDFTGEELLLIGRLIGRISINLAEDELVNSNSLYNEIVYQYLSRIKYNMEILLPFLQSELRNKTKGLIEELNSLNYRFYVTMFSLAIALTLVFQLGSSLFVFRSSRVLGLNIAAFEKNMSSVAEGNFDVDLELSSKDEFEDIAHHFKTIIQDIWDRIDSLKNMMRSIGVQDDYNKMKKALMDIAIEYSHADAAAIIIPTEKKEMLLSLTSGFFPPLAPMPASLPKEKESITKWYSSLAHIPEEENLHKVMENLKPIFIKDNNKELIHNSYIEDLNYISSAMFIPLIISGKIESILCLVISDPERAFSELDYSFMQILGDFIVATLDNTKKYIKLLESQKLSREVEVATHIQKTILPSHIPKLKGMKIAAYSDAAKGIGGDYYDFFKLDEDKVAVIICDVSGKGVPASILMVMIRTLFRSITGPEKDSKTTLIELNKLIMENADIDQFATLSILIINTHQKTIAYSNGAHHPLYIFRSKTREFRIFDSDGLPVGIDINADYSQKNIKVQDGDYMILFTDGLVEARNPEGKELGLKPILRLLASNAKYEPNEVVNRIRNFIQSYAGSSSQHDDQTMIAIKIS